MAVGLVLVLLALALLLRTVKGTLPNAILDKLEGKHKPHAAAPAAPAPTKPGRGLYPGQPVDPKSGKPVVPGAFGDIPLPDDFNPHRYDAAYHPDRAAADAIARAVRVGAR